MLEKIDGLCLKELLGHGIKNLSFYCDEVNELNVFPVPDGDTGTNMVMTLKNGFTAIKDEDRDLSVISKKFADAVVLGARGNSGVIISQFFKGFSEKFYGKSEADCTLFLEALENGVKSAYKSVAHPVEGTVLTVLREATDSCREKIRQNKVKYIEALIALFINKAKESLENTTNILPVLKNAGVVDSGGAGIVYVFDGMRKFFDHEEILIKDNDNKAAETVDYSLFNSSTEFKFGYCTELLIQMTDNSEKISQAELTDGLSAISESVVVSTEGDKIKIHTHTGKPEEVLAYCHKFGEFLSLKIENMTVQNIMSQNKQVEVSADRRKAKFSVVAVASDRKMKEILMEMGADVIVNGGQCNNPSASDFIEAYRRTESRNIIVFPNNANIILAAQQAKELFAGAEVHIIQSKSVAECYSALAIIDYEEENTDYVVKKINDSIDNLFSVNITNAVRNVNFDGNEITTDDVVAVSGSKLIAVGSNAVDTAKKTISSVMDDDEKSVITLFAGKMFDSSMTEEVVAFVEGRYRYTETCVVETENEIYDLIILFE